MNAGFLVNIHYRGSEGGQRVNPFFGLHNHQMHVEGLAADSCHSLYHRKTEGNIRNEHTVHHIEVKHIGVAAVNHINVGAQVGEVGREKRWGDEHGI